PSRSAPGRSEQRIEDHLKERQEILVQVLKDPMGHKGARLTRQVTLPGRFLVFLPGVDHVGVSRRIEDEEERERLRGVVQDLARRLEAPGGFIVRTAGQHRGDESFEPDAKALVGAWSAVLSRRARAGARAVPAGEAG